MGSSELVGGQYNDILIAKMDHNGNWVWAGQSSGNSNNYEYKYSSGVAIDINNDIFVTGDFVGSISFGSTQLNSSGNSDIFLAKILSSTPIIDDLNIQSTGLTLFQNFPNPFSSKTSIIISNEKNIEDFNISIYDIKGRNLKTLQKGFLAKGKHTFIWEGENANNHNLPSGVYLCKFTNRDKSEVRKMILIR